MRPRKHCMICMLLLTCFRCMAQGPVEAELAFAKHAKDHSIKKAFLFYADSSAVVFANGKIANAISSWTATPEFSGLLEWEPSLCGISAAGDLAFNTGPFTFRASAADTVSGSGYFNTIWVKNTKGEWKFLADLGTDTKDARLDHAAPRFVRGLTPATDGRSIEQVETDFIRVLAEKGNNAYAACLSADSWFNVDGVPALTDTVSIRKAMTRIPHLARHTIVGSGISLSKDLGFVYGYSEVNGRKGNYLRLWGHTGSGWKILLQVLKP